MNEILVFWVPAGAVVLLIPALIVGAKAYTRRQRRLDREAVDAAHASRDAAEADAVEAKRIAESDETRWERDDREFPASPLGLWIAGEDRTWLKSGDKAVVLRVKEIEAKAADHGDRILAMVLTQLERDAAATVEFLRVHAHARGETWAGQPWTRDDWLIAEHGYERPEDLRAKAGRPATITDTAEMSAADRRALQQRLARERSKR